MLSCCRTVSLLIHTFYSPVPPFPVLSPFSLLYHRGILLLHILSLLARSAALCHTLLISPASIICVAHIPPVTPAQSRKWLRNQERAKYDMLHLLHHTNIRLPFNALITRPDCVQLLIQFKHSLPAPTSPCVNTPYPSHCSSPVSPLLINVATPYRYSNSLLVPSRANPLSFAQTLPCAPNPFPSAPLLILLLYILSLVTTILLSFYYVSRRPQPI